MSDQEVLDLIKTVQEHANKYGRKMFIVKSGDVLLVTDCPAQFNDLIETIYPVSGLLH